MYYKWVKLKAKVVRHLSLEVTTIISSIIKRDPKSDASGSVTPHQLCTEGMWECSATPRDIVPGRLGADALCRRRMGLNLINHSAFRSSPGGGPGGVPGGDAGSGAPPPPLFLPPHLSHLSQHLNQLSQPFFPLKGWGAPCPCCPKEEARSSSVAELRRKAHEHSAALLHSLASFQSRALLPLPLPLPLPPLPMLHEPPPPPPTTPPKHLD
ncbi:hypothetical protein EVAR_76417_1 [Eumeta japonica]|uniref:OAR domain-containing protein n=1 Tax=Eumeta variegata TaxID=151549 RepID=A0A4C1TAT6_EUMVA|nr:hypothetical protein EVAR_76417_1 [Eumeta japonica]